MKIRLVYMLSLGFSSLLFLQLATLDQDGSVTVGGCRGSPLLRQCNLSQLPEDALTEAAFLFGNTQL